MEAVSSPMVAAAKLPVLNPVIVNGDSPPPKRIDDGVEKTYPPTTVEDKLARKNELKARGTLLMALPNEHQLMFNTYKCVKTLIEDIEKRFGGNKESRKTQKTLLKQQYENFNGSSSEGLDQTYYRLQKLIRQLEILGETVSQEHLNLKFLRSLPSEWKTHTLIWRNKPDLDTLSMDDLYNNLMIYETEVKGSSSSNQNSQNVAFVSSNKSGSSNQTHGSNSANIDSMSDDINVDDIEEIDLKWQMAMLTMRARRFLNKTGSKISVNGSETIGFNKSKVECYNCHKRGHFARDCRAPKENRNKEPIRRNVTVETIETKALVAQDGLRYDWSDQAKEGPTNFALMAYTSSGSSCSDSEVSTCSKACPESVETRLDVYKKNKVVYEEDIKILKLDIMLRDNALTELRKKFEKAKKERDDLKLTLEKLENSSMNLSKLLEIQVSDKFKTDVGYDSQVVNSQVFDSQVNDKYKTGEGYHAVPPPYTGNFMPLKPNLVLVDEEEYVFNWISDSEDENETEFKSKQRKPSFAKVEFVKSNEHVKIPKESIEKVKNNKQAKYPRKNSQSPRGNKRNWNNLMTQKLGSNFEFKNKACYMCGSFNHLIKDCDFYEKKMAEKPIWNNARRVNHQNSQGLTHPHSKRNFVPRAVLMKFGLKTLNTARQNSSRASVNTARPINTAYPRPTVNCARPLSNVFNKAHSHVRRPFNKFTTYKNSNFNEKVNTVKGNVTIVRPKAVANPQLELQEKGVINSGCSRHMTGNKSYLSNYEEINGGFVAFGGSTKGGKITGKGKIRTGKLDFKDVYFVEELKFNLFSISQMCDKKNNVLFTDTECVVLSPDFKLLDENQFLLRVPKKNNMYSVDLKNVVPSGENQINHRVKIIRCDNGTEFKNKEMNQFYVMKGIKREFSVARTPQQNEVAERKNRTLIEAARTMYQKSIDAGQAKKKTVPSHEYILLPLCTQNPSFSSSLKDSPNAGFKPSGEEKKKDAEHLENKDNEVPNIEEPRVNQEKDENVNSTNIINTVSSTVNTASIVDNAVDENIVYRCVDDPNMPNLEEIVYSEDDEDVGAEADMNNLDTFMPISPIPTTRIHKDHPFEKIIRDLHSAPQTKRMTKIVTKHAQKGNPSIKRSKLDRSYARRASAVQVTTCLDLGGFTIRQKSHWVFLAYASFKDFVVYQMDVKSAFLYGKIEEEVYRGTIDKNLFIKKIKGDILLVQVYVDDIIFGSTKKSLCTEFEKLMHKKFQMSSMGELTFFLGLQVTQKNDGIFISQDKSMIGSLMYLTSSRPDIMFVVYACARFQVTPKVSHLHVVRRIFRYLKDQLKLDLWYPKDSPFDLEAYTDSDYAGASLDKKSTIGGCQFLGSRLISWQCKKQTVIANSTTEVEYVAALNCCGQVLWIQNQLLDYGYNFMNTKIFIDNESTICIVKN
ncbi:putative ribonuclease H-like domain-containing protein [Tanacetum coccineum]|uniref:Ribonuclease H-like domain-containing protein n=1 Tax=Tanacetum coccineum TaxID=301880 RepID=A0ABQ5IEM0_9ASTR